MSVLVVSCIVASSSGLLYRALIHRRDSGFLITTRKTARDMRLIFSLGGSVAGVTFGCTGRQFSWQWGDEKVIEFLDQSMLGLYRHNQGLPTIIFQPASLVTWKVRSSICWSIVNLREQVWVICSTLERTPSTRTRSSGFLLRSRGRFRLRAKSRSINWELAPESIRQEAVWLSLMRQGKIRGFSNPNSPDTYTEDNRKTVEWRIRRASLSQDLREIPKAFPDPSIWSFSKTEKGLKLTKEMETGLTAPGCILALRDWPSVISECFSFLKPHKEAHHVARSLGWWVVAQVVLEQLDLLVGCEL